MEKGPMEKGKYKCEFLREVLYFGQYAGVTWKPKYHLHVWKIFLLVNMKLKQDHGDHQEHFHFCCCSMA